MLSGNDWKLYTNFEFCEVKNHIGLQSHAICDDKNSWQKILYLLKDGASGVQVGDIEQTNVQNLLTMQ